jgi:hypothetical protein
MIWHFDHRFSTYDAPMELIAENGKLPELTEEQHRNPSLFAILRYCPCSLCRYHSSPFCRLRLKSPLRPMASDHCHSILSTHSLAGFSETMQAAFQYTCKQREHLVQAPSLRPAETPSMLTALSLCVARSNGLHLALWDTGCLNLCGPSPGRWLSHQVCALVY